MNPIYADLMYEGERAREHLCDLSGAEVQFTEAMIHAHSIDELGEARNQYALNLWYQGRRRNAENIWYDNIRKFPGTMVAAHAMAHMVNVWLSRRNLHSAKVYATKAIDEVREIYPKSKDIPNDYVWFLGRWAKTLEVNADSRLLVAKICAEQRTELQRVRGRVTKAQYAAWLEGFYRDMCYAHPVGTPIYLILWLVTAIRFGHWLPIYKIIKRR